MNLSTPQGDCREVAASRGWHQVSATLISWPPNLLATAAIVALMVDRLPPSGSSKRKILRA